MKKEIIRRYNHIISANSVNPLRRCGISRSVGNEICNWFFYGRQSFPVLYKVSREADVFLTWPKNFIVTVDGQHRWEKFIAVYITDRGIRHALGTISSPSSSDPSDRTVWATNVYFRRLAWLDPRTWIVLSRKKLSFVIEQ